ncbi:MAG: histidinol-phosphate transaminase [Dehalococcoidia bacterium]|nr:histidinol-phosphate transaminase [Dehalococcoidia bacterium]
MRFNHDASLRPALRALRGYEPIAPPEVVAMRYGVPPERIVKLDGNENPYGPSPRALAVLAAPYAAHRYPDPDQRRLREALAARHGVPAECIVAGAGSDELIDLLFRTYVRPRDHVVIASPTFGMYAFDAELHDAEVVDVPLRDDWAPDADALVAAAASARIVFIPSPNNPTGGTLPPALVERLLDSGALLVVDEAYIEFAHAPSLVERAAAGEPLVVLRTFSKWAGLAGLRVGYGVLPAPMARVLMQVKQPYGVNVAAEVAALASLEDRALLDERACALTGERDRLAAQLAGLGWLHPAPSEANFLLVRLDRGDAVSVREALRRHGVFVRAFDHSRLRRHVRISVGTAADSTRLLEALTAIAGELATEGEARS